MTKEFNMMTDEDVIAIIRKSVWTKHSTYIHKEMCREGIAVTSARLKKRLEGMAKRGLLKRSPFPDGYYGYRWEIVE